MAKTPVLFLSGALFAFTTAFANAATAPPPVVSNSTVTISGPGIGGVTKTFSLPFMNNYANKGDWYVTPSDAHAAFFVADKSPFAAADKSTHATVDLLLNGTGKTFLITPDSAHPAVHKTDLAIDVLVGSTKFSTVDPGDQVTFTVTKMDMLNFEATFTGSMTEVGMMERSGHEAHRVTVTGSISLHRASAPAPINAGNWVNCDPIVHDWLNEAQDRASSDCEVKFDHHLQVALNAAFTPMESALTASEWQIVNKPDPSVLFLSAPRGSEKEPFHGQGFKLTMAVNPNSAQGQQAMAVANTPDPLMVKMMELLKAGKYAEAQELQKQLDAKLKNAPPAPSTRFTVQVSFNFAGREFINFHGAFSTQALPGGGTVLYLPAMQGLGGGSGGDPGTWVLLGPWSQPASTHLDGETTKVATKAQMNPSAPRLSVQNIAVYLNCDQNLAAKAIQAINWSQLRALLAQ
jgi:plastocyanin